MQRSTLFLLLGALVFGPVAAHAVDGAPVTGCEAHLAAGPKEEEGYRCLYEESLRVGASAIGPQLARAAAEHPSVGWPLFYLGLLHWDDPEAAVEHLAGAAARFVAAGEARGEVLARGNRQQLLFGLGRLAEAGREAELAARAGGASGDAELAARGKIYLARHLLTQGEDLERSFRILREIAAGLTADTPFSLTRNCLASLGWVSLEIGHGNDARAAYERLRDEARGVGDAYYEAAARYGLTRVAAERLAESPSPEREEETVRLAREALNAADAAGAADLASMSHWVLGMLAPLEERRDHLETCAALASSAREEAYCLDALARHLVRSAPDEAQRIVDRALALAEEAEDPYSAAFAWRERMRVAWAAESASRAIETSRAALTTIEALRDRQDDGSVVQAGLFSTWSDDYQWLAGRILEEARSTGRGALLAEAFAVSERLRARALTDSLRNGGGEASGPRAAPVFASLTDVQRALGPREALLTFQVAPWKDLAGDFGGGSWMIAVTRRSVRAYPLPGRREVRNAVNLYTGLFEHRDGSEAAPSAHFYRQLLASALEELPERIDRLVIVPDDALHRLPFGALRPAAGAPPLAVTHRVSVAPSATLWLAWRRDRMVRAGADAPRGALVLAAPVPRPELADAIPGGLPALRHAAGEGRSVAAAFGTGTDLAVGSAASEGLLRSSDLSRFGVLHLATHAVTDEARPERSAVVLSPAGPGEDGLLEAGEIAALDLSGKLVVLSSCRSASGAVLRGEGAMSLGRAFFQAGAHTVVASLWPLRDDDAEALFERFYRHLARGETVAGALQAAQRERRAEGAPAAAWAGLVVLGDGDLRPMARMPRPPEAARYAMVLPVLLAALVLALALVLLRRRLAGRSGLPGRQRLAERPSLSQTIP